jgi:predicted nucleic acid-binding protein
MIFLLDNNVLSELWKPKPAPEVVEWFFASEWLLPVPVIAEIQEGAEASPSEARKLEITARLDTFLRRNASAVLDFDADTARVWGRLKHSTEVKRKPQALWDSLIDAMAVQHNATVATRNGKDFRHAQTFNPFPSEDPPAQAPA